VSSRLAQRVLMACCWAAALLLIGAVAAVLGFLLLKGAGALTPELIFGEAEPLAALSGRAQVFDGILPAIVGTTALVLLAVGIALPVGIAAGVYFAVYAPAGLRRVLSLLTDVLASIPSIVVGLFGLTLVILMHKHLSARVYPSLLISGVALACLVLPYIIRTTEVAIEGVDQETRLTALALGASRLQNIFKVLLPRSLSGILSGCILAIGRCAEDTAVIMLTGVVASVGLPGSLLGRYEAVPFFIYYTSSQYADQHELMQGYGAAIVLLAICSWLFLLAWIIKGRLAGLAFRRV